MLATASAALIIASLAAQSGATPAAVSTSPSFYEHSVSVGLHRIDGGALRRGAFRSEPQAMDPIAWIDGEWEQTNMVLAVNSIPAKTTPAGIVRFAVDREDMIVTMQGVREGSRSHRLAVYDPYARRWVRVIDGSGGYGVLAAPGWQGDRLDLIGEATFLGRSFMMRHSIVRTGPDGFELQNSEQLPDGSWRMFDKHVYQRRGSADAGPG